MVSFKHKIYYARIGITVCVRPLQIMEHGLQESPFRLLQVPQTKNTELSTLNVDNSVENCAEVLLFDLLTRSVVAQATLQDRISRDYFSIC
jgi:hypothetical protein